MFDNRRYSKVVEITTATKILGSKKQPNWLHFKLIPGMIRMGNLKDTMLQYQKKLNCIYNRIESLLRSDSHNKFMVGSRTYLFWASSNSEASKESENSLFSLLGRIEEENERPKQAYKVSI